MMTVSKFDVNRATGFTDVVICFNNKYGNPVSDSQSFTKEQDARRYVRSSQRSWIVEVLEDYINHKRIVISEGGNNKNPTVMESLSRCVAFLKWITGENRNIITLNEICHFTLLIKGHLEKIIPHHHNKSYESSREKYLMIVAFCNNTLKELKDAQS